MSSSRATCRSTPAHAGQIAGARRAIGPRQQRAVGGHRLCRVLDAARRARRPCARNGLSASRWLVAVQRMRWASHSVTASSRHMLPWCGRWASSQA